MSIVTSNNNCLNITKTFKARFITERWPLNKCRLQLYEEEEFSLVYS